MCFIRKLYKIIILICTVIGTISPIAFYIISNQTKRAELSLLIDPASDYKWEQDTPERNIFSVNFSLSNEGARTAIIKQFELVVMYIMPSGDYSGRTATFSNFKNVWNVTNPPVRENEVRGFYLSMYVYESFAVDATGAVVSVGNSQPDRFRVTVVYDDGLDGTITTERTFDLK